MELDADTRAEVIFYLGYDRLREMHTYLSPVELEGFLWQISRSGGFARYRLAIRLQDLADAMLRETINAAATGIFRIASVARQVRLWRDRRWPGQSPSRQLYNSATEAHQRALEDLRKDRHQ